MPIWVVGGGVRAACRTVCGAACRAEGAAVRRRCEQRLSRSSRVLHAVHKRATDAKCPVGTFCEAEPAKARQRTKGPTLSYKAEYIWIDGTEPTARLRSKTRILADGAELPDWGFDGSSTNQAPGDHSDCVLKPVFSCPDPIRGGDNKLVLCEVYLVDGTPHETNTRAKLRP